MSIKEIPNDRLSERDMPIPNATWRGIIPFALSFNGYIHIGSFDACAELANDWRERWRREKILPTRLAELRACLFFEQRRSRHCLSAPGGEFLHYIHSLIEAIRGKVRDGDRQ